MRLHNEQLVKFLVKQPLLTIKAFEESLNKALKSMREDVGSQKGGEKTATRSETFPSKTSVYYVNFEGTLGKNHVTPRGLRSELLNNFVAVQGIVTKMSIVQPRMQTSVHYCEKTKRGYVKNYEDQYNIEKLAEEMEGREMEESNALMIKDEQGNPVQMEYGYCVYKDYQEIVVQELPERAPAGQLPRSVKVVLQNDLVDKVKPGDRVEVTGVFKARRQPNMPGSAIASTVLIATGIKSINLEKERPNLSEQDLKNIKKLSKDEKVFDVLGNSVAASIEGMLSVKKAVLLQLLGGAEKNLENGTHLRGDINILMVGDPSTAKSQLLRHIMDIAPLAINTTGRGSTGVGLTAAVTTDKDTGERHLEAGAMVLADRGIVCIDEFDKMNDIDRVAIHEVMEQQTVTISKAGLHVSLNARCSVIAAANPVYSEYCADLSVGRNVAMPDSLLSRFDLLFIMLDEKDPEKDRLIAERVIQNHRYQDKSAIEQMPLFNYFGDDNIIEADMNDIPSKQREEKGKVYVDKGLIKRDELPVVTREFLKKYISYAKAQKAPELNQDCIEYAACIYAGLRTKALNYDPNKVSVPITVRTLETLIRLSTAHSKLRLSKEVENADIEIAAQLLNASIF